MNTVVHGRLNRLYAVALLIAGLAAPASTRGQDHCSDILTSGVHNTFQDISKNNAKSSYQQALCDQFNSSNIRGSNTTGGVSATGYGSLNFGNNDSNAQTLYHKYCEGSQQQMSDDDFHSLVQVTIDPNIVVNWKECEASHGQGLYGNVDVNGNDLLFTLEWLGFSGVGTTKVNGLRQVTGAVCPQASFTKGTVLHDQVSVTELCHRLGDNAVTFVINTTGGSKTLKLDEPLRAPVVPTASYRPADPSLVVPLNLLVTRTDVGGTYHLDISFTAPTLPAPPPAPLAAPTCCYTLITVYGSQRVGSTYWNFQDLPTSRFLRLQELGGQAILLY